MTTTAAQSPATRAPAANAEALQHFSARLAFETDVSDVAADLAAEAPGMLVVDTRSLESWNQGHVPGAISAGLGDALFWWSLGVSLAPAYGGTRPNSGASSNSGSEPGGRYE